MMICPKCANPLTLASCDQCGWTFERIDGIEVFAPEFAEGGGGFDVSYFSKLAELEAGNFWFQSRNDLILWALGKYHRNLESFMEVGCGTGFVLSGVTGAYPRAKISGSEIFMEGLRYASRRVPTARLMQMDARTIPFAGEFDVIGAFDVLEHIDEDEVVLEQMNKALKPDGTLLITVPQHPWLWSSVDEFSHHYRRYAADELNRKISAAGFTILRNTSFVSLLLPVMLASRVIYKNKPIQEINVEDELKLPRLLNYAFRWIMQVEGLLLKAGLDLPLGGSRLVVAKKTGANDGLSHSAP